MTIRWRTRPGDAAEQKVYEELNALVNTQLASKNIKASYDPGANQGYFEKIKTEQDWAEDIERTRERMSNYSHPGIERILRP